MFDLSTQKITENRIKLEYLRFNKHFATLWCWLKYMGFKHFIFKNWSKSIGVSFQMIAFFGPIFYCTLSLRLFAVRRIQFENLF